MTRTTDGSGNMPPIISSPPSGSEETYYNTPSTNITVLSPETAANHSSASVPAPKLNLRSLQMVSGMHHATESRAVHALTIPTPTEPAALSPVATEFTPTVSSAVYPGQKGHEVPTPTYGAIGQAVPGRATASDIGKHFHTVLDANFSIAIGVFSNEESISRAFEMFSEPKLAPVELAAAFPVHKFASLDQIDSSEWHHGVQRVVFNNIRDARLAYIDAFYTAFPQAQLSFLSPKDLAIARGDNPANVSNYAAQILITVSPVPGRNVTFGQVYNVVQSVGDIYAIHTVDRALPGRISFRIEFADIRDVDVACRLAIEYPTFGLLVDQYKPDLRGVNFSSPVVATPITSPGPVTGSEQLSLTGRSTLPVDRLAEIEALLARLMADNTLPTRGYGRPGHNQVDIQRIQEGSDVRTTIMLRNIPNKVTQTDLKRFLDETSVGFYDFMYLRIDFANNCNVGYAFVNFLDPLAIIPFARRRAGAKWLIYDSNKVAEISYATIQGRDCLIQKFRNSSVMLEHPSFRPKLYLTFPHPMAGTEEHFPGPDNFSKMRRSIENAEHIGLYLPFRGRRTFAAPPARAGYPTYTPRLAYDVPHFMTGSSVDVNSPRDPFFGAITTQSPTETFTSHGLFAPREGQQHREEQRRRRSQFDRGTPGAEYEAQMLVARNLGVLPY